MLVRELMQQLSICNPDSVVLMNVDEEDGVKSVDRCQLVATHVPAPGAARVGVIQLSGDNYYHSIDNAIQNIF